MTFFISATVHPIRYSFGKMRNSPAVASVEAMSFSNCYAARSTRFVITSVRMRILRVAFQWPRQE